MLTFKNLNEIQLSVFSPSINKSGILLLFCFATYYTFHTYMNLYISQLFLICFWCEAKKRDERRKKYQKSFQQTMNPTHTHTHTDRRTHTILYYYNNSVSEGTAVAWSTHRMIHCIWKRNKSRKQEGGTEIYRTDGRFSSENEWQNEQTMIKEKLKKQNWNFVKIKSTNNKNNTERKSKDNKKKKKTYKSIFTIRYRSRILAFRMWCWRTANSYTHMSTRAKQEP